MSKTYRPTFPVFAPLAKSKLMSIETQKVFVKDKIAADDAWVKYLLTNNRILAQTEEVVIETRDRFQSDVVLNRHIMVRYLDYKLDYYTGELIFLQPLDAFDEDLNPKVIVVEYAASENLERIKTHNARGQAELLDKKTQVRSKSVNKIGGAREKISLLTRRRAKYLSVISSILLSGVTITGLVSGHMFSPQIESDFLHEHLNPTTEISDLKWENSDLVLPPQDQNKIFKIITRTETPNLTSEKMKSLTGQALRKTQAQPCDKTQKTCRFSIRLNRSLKVQNGNNDYRVINVEETSLRVDIEVNADTQEVNYNGIANETRLLRFYQTQAGWMQNTSEIIKTDVPVFDGRKDKFRTKFLQKLVGINYYPASASWKDFWIEFPVDAIKSDLQNIRALNANSVRIFLTHDYFDHVETREDALSKLNIFLKLCEDNGIKVLVTLFDLRPNYELGNLQADINHINRILPTLSSHKAVLGVDIKNQADLDFKNWGQDRVKGWLTIMMRHIHMQYPEVALTVGWSKAENATGLKDTVDFVTYHEYESPENFGGRLNKIVSAVDDKPVMITELGSTVWTPFKTKHAAEARQAHRLETQLSQAGPVSGVFLWTLHDFDHVGREVVGPLPWRQAQQRHFGLIRSDGTIRPAANVLKQYGAQYRSNKPKSNITSLTLNSNGNF